MSCAAAVAAAAATALILDAQRYNGVILNSSNVYARIALRGRDRIISDESLVVCRCEGEV